MTPGSDDSLFGKGLKSQAIEVAIRVIPIIFFEIFCESDVSNFGTLLVKANIEINVTRILCLLDKTIQTMNTIIRGNILQDFFAVVIPDGPRSIV